MSLLIPPHSKVLFTGDSITDCGRRGGAAPLGEGYVRMVTDLLLGRYPEHEATYINTGIGGNIVRELFDRLTDDVIRHQPDWLSIMIGINDCNGWLSKTPGRDIGPEVYAEYLDKILTRVKHETKATVVLISPFFMSIDRESQSYRRRVLEALPGYQQAVRAASEKYGTHFVDFHAMFQRLLQDWPTDRFGTEPVHPNQTGHLLMAQEWLRGVGFV